MEAKLIEQLQQQVETLYQLAEQRFSRHFPRPKVRLDLKGRSAGQAWLEKNELRFNLALLKRYPEDFIQQTVPHEVAHLLARELCGPRIRPHGAEWKQLMTGLFKRPATVRHQYQLPPSHRYRFTYRCNCQQLQLSATRHNRVLRGAQYLCRECRSPLEFIAENRASA